MLETGLECISSVSYEISGGARKAALICQSLRDSKSVLSLSISVV